MYGALAVLNRLVAVCFTVAISRPPLSTAATVKSGWRDTCGHKPRFEETSSQPTSGAAMYLVAVPVWIAVPIDGRPLDCLAHAMNKNRD